MRLVVLKRFKNIIFNVIISLCIIIFFVILVLYNKISNKEHINYSLNEEKTTQIEAKDNYNKVVYLTFDDGPSTNIDYLLDMLDKYNAKATFFMVGSCVETMPELALKVYKRGHSIGMHSYSHSEKIYDSINSFKEDLDKCEKIFKKLFGFRPNIYRLPFGSYNKYLSKEKLNLVSKELLKRGYNYYDWNASTGDGSKNVIGYSIYVNAVNGMKDQEMPVILMHDPNKNTMDVIEYILQYGFMNNYKFDVLTADTKPMRYEQ